jgi:hypothetical protein
MKFISILLILVTFITVKPTYGSQAKQKLTVAIILPKDLFRQRNINTWIANEIRAVATSSYAFLSSFYLEG